MKLKTFAELDKLHDELVKKSAVLEQRIAALKPVQRKPKRATK
jgi:hypothetical protein